MTNSARRHVGCVVGTHVGCLVCRQNYVYTSTYQQFLCRLSRNHFSDQSRASQKVTRPKSLPAERQILRPTRQLPNGESCSGLLYDLWDAWLLFVERRNAKRLVERSSLPNDFSKDRRRVSLLEGRSQKLNAAPKGPSPKLLAAPRGRPGRPPKLAAALQETPALQSRRGRPPKVAV